MNTIHPEKPEPAKAAQKKYSAPRSRRFRIFLSALLMTALGLASSCSNHIGWGLVLWTVQGTTARSGSIVPVYLKSNITRQYVIGADPKSRERIEVPLWQVEVFRSRRLAERRASELGALAPLYLIAARDGLPVHPSPSTSTDKRVYRLREGEMVKALAEVEGEALYTGGQRLPGRWYEILTKDGTRGYVFSYTMRLYDENSGESPASIAGKTNTAAIDTLFSRTWRPAWYQGMMNEATVDLDYFSLRFGLFADAKNRQIRIELPATSRAFSYTAISQDGDWLVFEGTELRIFLESQTSLIASWSPASATPAYLASAAAEIEDSAGWTSADTLVRFSVPDHDVRELMRAEEGRRGDAIKSFFATVAGVSGQNGNGSGVQTFSSPQAGSLEFWPSGLYSWTDSAFLPAGFSPSSDESKDVQKGTVVFGARLSPELSQAWQGGFALYPEDTGLRSDYLYRLDRKGFVIARALPAPPGVALSRIDPRFGTVTLDYPHAR